MDKKLTKYRCKHTLGAFITLILINFACNHLVAQAQHNMQWNNKRSAVVLTYDDALNVHLDKVIPILNANAFKGTFYTPGNAITLNTRLLDWRQAAFKGHELGNHTMFHPCDGSLPGREWVSKDHDLSQYTLVQIVDEIRVANTLLKAIDGKDERTFAYTCGDMQVSNGNFVDSIRSEFVAARGVTRAYDQLENMDLFNIHCHSINGQSAEEMIAIVEKGLKENALVVFLFHGVGGEHKLNVALDDHNDLVKYLKDNEEHIWVDNMLEVSKFIKNSKK